MTKTQIKYSQIYTIPNSEMDVEYKIKRTSLIMYFQDTFARYLTTKYLAAFDIDEMNLIWVIADLNIEYLSDMPFWSEEIRVEVWISEISKIKLYSDFVIYYNENPIAKGNACWFILDMISRRPVNIDFVANKIDIIPDIVAGEHKRLSINDITSTISTYKHKISLSDIDINNHTNNLCYLRIALAAIPEEFISTHEYYKLNVRFMKETFLHDELTCTVYKTDNPDKMIFITEKENTTVCQVMVYWKGKSINSIKQHGLKIRN